LDRLRQQLGAGLQIFFNHLPKRGLVLDFLVTLVGEQSAVNHIGEADVSATSRSFQSCGEIAHTLGGHRIGQNSFVVRCPAHQDKTPSLSIGESADGVVLFHCHAGCPIFCEHPKGRRPRFQH
jgi:hypothetical protein